MFLVFRELTRSTSGKLLQLAEKGFAENVPPVQPPHPAGAPAMYADGMASPDERLGWEGSCGVLAGT